MKGMARVTGLEPATSGVTGRHSNRLSYTRAFPVHDFGVSSETSAGLVFACRPHVARGLRPEAKHPA
jgi:hypothetical protein